MTRVIHTGDTHVGYQQYHVPERREDFLQAFEQVVTDAIDEEVDAVVHAGDLFHDRRPTLSDVLGTVEALRRLDEADVPFLAVVGNHEVKRDAQWLDLFESLGLATRLDDEPLTVGNTAFYGLDFVPRSRRDDLSYDFVPHDAEFAALVAHGLFEPFDFGTWDSGELLSSATVSFDAVLLGDNHEHETVQVEDTWLTYCGSTERASAQEVGDRGYNIVSFEGDDDVVITRRGLDTREFVTVDVELGPDDGLERIHERIREYDVEDAVVIVEVDGAGEPVSPAGIEEYAMDRGALVARVTDHRERSQQEEETSISFADPDDAVRERVRELGLSPAARAIDETIRASKIPDSRVADEVESRVSDLVADGDLSAFESGPDGEEPASADEEQSGSGNEERSDSEDEEQSASGDEEGSEIGVSEEETDDAGQERPDEECDEPGQASVGDFT